VPTPAEYLKVLGVANGFAACGFEMYGVASPDRLLNRRAPAPLDVALAVKSWAAEFNQRGLFHFASRP
jgi:hypothetical protein